MSGFKSYDLASLMQKELKRISKVKKGLYKKASRIMITDNTAGGISLREFAELENQCYPADPMFPVDDIEYEFEDKMDMKIKDMDESLRVDIADYYLDGNTMTEVSYEPVDEVLIFGTSTLYIIVLRAGKTMEIADACSEKRTGGNARPLLAFFKHLMNEVQGGSVNKVVGAAREKTSWPILERMFRSAQKRLEGGFDITMNNRSISRPDADNYGQDESYQQFQIEISQKTEI